MYKNFGKRFLDITVASIVLIGSSPLLFLTAVILAFNNRGKIFFIQPRPGKDEKIFNLIKFKTMNDRTDRNGDLLPDSERLTFWGKIIRKTSVDELPQFINVLLGHMSVIGPRPLLVEYLPRYSERQRLRHRILPGITGWAQVNGRNSLSWNEKFELDVWYVENYSGILDLKIVWLTIVKIFKSEGINNSDSITMTKFTGNN